MEGLSQIHHIQQPLNPPLVRHRPLFSRSISSLSIRTRFSSSWLSSPISMSIRATSSSSPSSPSSSSSSNPKTLKPAIFETLKTTSIAVASAALFLAHYSAHKHAVAAPTATVEPSEMSIRQKEFSLEDYLEIQPKDPGALRGIVEIKIKTNKLTEAVEYLDRLITVQPHELEWPLLRAHIHINNGDRELAKKGFDEVLSKDPLLVEAYHGLLMAVSQSKSVGRELSSVMKRVEEAMERCKEEEKWDILRDFKLLVGQIKLTEENYDDALKVYQELVKEKPGDFRPYLCQGVIFTLLGKKDEADKQFQKYRQLVPKDDPYVRFFEDNMMATRGFSQMAENQGAASKK